jgi:hypothetical protein
LLDIIILLIILLLFNLFFKFKVVFYTIHRLSIAAIHYNENCGRQQLVTENSDLYYNISYPKAKKGTENTTLNLKNRLNSNNIISKIIISNKNEIID